MINPLSTYRLFRALLKARAEIKDLTMTRDELLQQITTMTEEAKQLRAQFDQVTAESAAKDQQLAALQAQQDFSDLGAAVDGAINALQPQPATGQPAEQQQQ